MIWLCFVILAGGLAQAEEWTKKFRIGGAAELRVETNDAGVTVRTWDAREIEARVTTKGWRIGPDEVRVIDRQTGDRVDLEVRLPKQRGISLGGRNAHIELRVPREIRSDIHTGDGAIRVEGLKGETRLGTGDGSIEADGLDGSLTAGTGDGRVRVRGRFERLDVKTGDGSVEVEVEPGSRMAGSWRVHTGDGSVTVRLPDGFAADIDAHTGDGHISMDLPLTVSGTMKKSDVRGKLNGGGETLTVRTGDGSIRLARR